ncbi:DUF3857 domain-containing protein [Arcticibacter eurypsychrophilus]|uniref:DUF3857 domain-containing protein n=1 Tax=Arcticibacter eurypsychrophilus TaxID=1434752 RepID=UPI00084D9A18|nr:DUF3857 domain-containing protein [Arcticibacter eurypsychrophilus]
MRTLRSAWHVIFCFAFIFPLFVSAQKKTAAADYYIAANIPDSLKKDANSVIRLDDTRIEIINPGKVVWKSHRILTILNQKAEDEAMTVMSYDRKFSTVNNPEMIVYDASGALIKRYKKSDMYDRSAVDGISIISDSRMLIASHTVTAYPVTIEMSYEYSLNGYLDLSDWDIQPVETAVQQATYQIIVSPGLGFRFKERNIHLKPEKSLKEGMEVYTWKVNNLKAQKLEEDCESWAVLPSISFATDKIEYYNQAGDFSSWKGFGLWQQTLNKEVCDLSPKRVEEIKQSVAHLPTDKGKARFLYESMQKNMRYVSIQLGIGGLRPFPASFVDEKKYGDCKALANYMYSVLKAAGIRSYYTLINAGDNKMPADNDFVCSPFNHVILCIPFAKDSVWLECTSSTAQFGKLGTFTENRKGLLITESGGELVRTPASRMEDHVFDTEAEVLIDSMGFAKASIRLKTTGGYRDSFVDLSSEKIDEQKERLISSLKLKQPDVFSITELSDVEGVRTTDLHLEYEKLSDMNTGKKFFYRPRLLDLWKTTFPVLEHRKSDVYFSMPCIKKNTTEFGFASNFEVESVPATVSIQFSYGSFNASYSLDKTKNKITCVSVFKLNKHVIPAGKYKEMQEFMDLISKSMNKKIIVNRI